MPRFYTARLFKREGLQTSRIHDHPNLLVRGWRLTEAIWFICCRCFFGFLVFEFKFTSLHTL